MMALTPQLRARTIKWNILTLTRTHRFFSTSNSDDGGPDSKSNSPFSSYFSDVKERLKKNPPTSTPPLRTSPSFSNPNPNPNPNPRPSNVDFEEIRKNLSEFRRRTSAPPPAADTSSEPILFQEIYNRNVPDSNSARNAGGGPSFDAIRQSMQKLRPSAARQESDPMSLPAFRKNLKWGPSSDSGSSVIGGTGEIPAAVFGKEMREKKDPAAAAAMSTEFVKMYSYSELGKKLRMLRPEGGGREWFSLGELNERLVRLREMEEEESLSTVTGVVYRDLRQSLERLQQSNEDKAKKTSLQKLDILGHLGRTPSSMLDPPQEHLVERYFHPDNMSSAEKLKIELAKVRDEFKMSESDCGSARVQVAQLTTKIKHLSTVLHKKDKHSRKGLLAMVQRRKRLLKYLRSTDWDSYCFVISKLGLRDNPDLKY